MSAAVASLEHAPSKSDFSPYNLARLAQIAIKQHQAAAAAEAGLIRQLMVGRYVRRKDDDRIWLVREVRMSLGWKATLYGRSKGRRARNAPIGYLAEIEIIQPPGSES